MSAATKSSGLIAASAGGNRNVAPGYFPRSPRQTFPDVSGHRRARNDTREPRAREHRPAATSCTLRPTFFAVRAPRRGCNASPRRPGGAAALLSNSRRPRPVVLAEQVWFPGRREHYGRLLARAVSLREDEPWPPRASPVCAAACLT